MSLIPAVQRTLRHRSMLLRISSACVISLLSGCSSPQTDSEAPPPPPPETSRAQDNEINPAPVDAAASEATNAIPDTARIEALPLRYEATGIAFLEPAEKTIPATAAKSNEVVEASGYGFPSPAATTSSQKMLTATEAAQYRAMAKLAEQHLGLNVQRVAKTSDMAFSGEDITVSISGTLRGVSEVSRSYDEDDEIATVTLKMDLEPEKAPEKQSPPPTLEQRKARAEVAARIHASALLREQIGDSYIEQTIQVTGMDLSHQEASIQIEGVVREIHFSNVRWTSERICEVDAYLEIQSENLDRDGNIQGAVATDNE